MKYLKAYLNQSSLHGLKYISEGKLVSEKIAWTFVVIAGFGLALSLITAAFG